MPSSHQHQQRPITPDGRKPIIAILGAGLIGCYLGGSLMFPSTSSSKQYNPLESPAEVHLIGRSSLESRLKSNNGITLTSCTDFSLTKRHIPYEHLNIHSSLKSLKESGVRPDFIILTAKRTANLACAKEMVDVGLMEGVLEGEEGMQADLGGGGVHGESGEWFWARTTVVVLQNGVHGADEIKSVVGQSVDVIDGMWPFNVVEASDGHFHQGSTGPVYICESSKGKFLTEILNEAGIECKSSPDIESILYGKLLVNLNNAVSALSGVPLKAELSQKQYRTVFAKCISEALAVYTAAGIHATVFQPVPAWTLPYILNLPDFAFLRIAASMLAIDEKATSSMYEDLKNNRKTEIDYLQGEISRLGHEHNVPTPVCDRIVLMVKAEEREGRGIVQHPGDEILDALELL
ncbi:hypothetical protein HDU76_005768 [Blyttiomyces sp. JEL0837]|nr:hypothetical protein HDU76_005768 [Blyttiomyces sp. JEL0837]